MLPQWDKPVLYRRRDYILNTLARHLCAVASVIYGQPAVPTGGIVRAK